MPTLIITGGSSGIGATTARLFASNGYNVYELSRHGEDTSGIRHICCDVSLPDDCKKAVAQVIEEEGQIDLLICNAGFGISGAIEFTDIEEAHRQMDVNFFGTVNTLQAVLPHMRRHKHGRIILIGSMAAVFPIPFQAFYSASKAAISALASSLRNEVRHTGIKVCCLLPGDARTGFTGQRRKCDYGSDIYPNMEKAIAVMEKDESNGMSPERIAGKLLSLASARRMPLFSTVGLQYHLFNALGKLLPQSLVCRIINTIYS